MDEMLLLGVDKVEGVKNVYKKYVVDDSYNVRFLTADPSSTFKTYNPMPSYEQLLLGILQTAHTILDCRDFWAYCIEKSGYHIRDIDLWGGEDFFESKSPDARKIIKALMQFVLTYGLPEWSVERTVQVPVPDRYAAMLAGKQDSRSGIFTVNTSYFDHQKKWAGKEVLPIGTLALMIVQWYNRFLYQQDGYVHMTGLDITFAHDEGKSPELEIKALTLNACVDLSYVLLVSAKKRALRQCKQCGDYFIANDLRAEYCSKKCRGAYNSAMTRRRKKELN